MGGPVRVREGGPVRVTYAYRTLRIPYLGGSGTFRLIFNFSLYILHLEPILAEGSKFPIGSFWSKRVREGGPARVRAGRGPIRVRYLVGQAGSD